MAQFTNKTITEIKVTFDTAFLDVFIRAKYNHLILAEDKDIYLTALRLFLLDNGMGEYIHLSKIDSLPICKYDFIINFTNISNIEESVFLSKVSTYIRSLRLIGHNLANNDKSSK
jgi:hypothetical protein